MRYIIVFVMLLAVPASAQQQHSGIRYVFQPTDEDRIRLTIVIDDASTDCTVTLVTSRSAAENAPWENLERHELSCKREQGREEILGIIGDFGGWNAFFERVKALHLTYR